MRLLTRLRRCVLFAHSVIMARGRYMDQTCTLAGCLSSSLWRLRCFLILKKGRAWLWASTLSISFPCKKLLKKGTSSVICICESKGCICVWWLRNDRNLLALCKSAYRLGRYQDFLTVMSKRPDSFSGWLRATPVYGAIGGFDTQCGSRAA